MQRQATIFASLLNGSIRYLPSRALWAIMRRPASAALNDHDGQRFGTESIQTALAAAAAMSAALSLTDAPLVGELASL